MNTNKIIAKSIVLNATVFLAAVAFNKYAASKLEKKENPGLLTRMLLWNCRTANKPAYLATVAVLKALEIGSQAYLLQELESK